MPILESGDISSGASPTFEFQLRHAMPLSGNWRWVNGLAFGVDSYKINLFLDKDFNRFGPGYSENWVSESFPMVAQTNNFSMLNGPSMTLTISPSPPKYSSLTAAPLGKAGGGYSWAPVLLFPGLNLHREPFKSLETTRYGLEHCKKGG